jgi:hypothetical protein
VKKEPDDSFFLRNKQKKPEKALYLTQILLNIKIRSYIRVFEKMQNSLHLKFSGTI